MKNFGKNEFVQTVNKILFKQDIFIRVISYGYLCSTQFWHELCSLLADRMLWSVATQREQMLNCQVVRTVALLLPVNQEDSGEQHLLLEIVKALVTFTNYHSEECAQQVWTLVVKLFIERSSRFYLELPSCHLQRLLRDGNLYVGNIKEKLSPCLNN